MPRPRNTSPPVEQKLDWPALLDTALTVPGSIGNTYNRFHTYSFLNQVFLIHQGVPLEPVATYNRWKAVGRQVVKGSKAAAIVRPITVKATEVNQDTGKEEEVKRRRFKVVRALFAISQTEGEPLPDIEVPGWDLETAEANLDVSRTEFRSMNGNMQGYSIGREYAINPVAVNPTKTTFHELGHIVLGHTAEIEDLDDEEEGALEQVHRGLGEFQAETTAYLAMNEVGLMTEDVATVSRGYIQSWLKGEQPSDSAIRGVFAATDEILRAGRPAGEDGDE